MDFMKSEMTICLACGLNDEYNNIAWSLSGVSPKMMINIEDKYAVGAGRQGHIDGVQVMMSTRSKDVSRGQIYALNAQGYDGDIPSTSDADVIQFRNGSQEEATAIVHQKVNGQMTPVHISGPIVQDATQHFEPSATVALWMDRQRGGRGTMVDANRSGIIDIHSETNVNVKFDGRFVKA